MMMANGSSSMFLMFVLVVCNLVVHCVAPDYDSTVSSYYSASQKSQTHHRVVTSGNGGKGASVAASWPASIDAPAEEEDDEQPEVDDEQPEVDEDPATVCNGITYSPKAISQCSSCCEGHDFVFEADVSKQLKKCTCAEDVDDDDTEEDQDDATNEQSLALNDVSLAATADDSTTVCNAVYYNSAATTSCSKCCTGHSYAFDSAASKKANKCTCSSKASTNNSVDSDMPPGMFVCHDTIPYGSGNSAECSRNCASSGDVVNQAASKRFKKCCCSARQGNAASTSKQQNVASTARQQNAASTNTFDQSAASTNTFDQSALDPGTFLCYKNVPYNRASPTACIRNCQTKGYVIDADSSRIYNQCCCDSKKSTGPAQFHCPLNVPYSNGSSAECVRYCASQRYNFDLGLSQKYKACCCNFPAKTAPTSYFCSGTIPYANNNTSECTRICMRSGNVINQAESQKRKKCCCSSRK